MFEQILKAQQESNARQDAVQEGVCLAQEEAQHLREAFAKQAEEANHRFAALEALLHNREVGGQVEGHVDGNQGDGEELADEEMEEM